MASPAQQSSLATVPPKDIITFYNELSSFAQHIPRHNVLTMNAQISKDENNKLCFHNLPNRNGKYLTDFSLENNLS